jgi:antibiotic biosynthesis monooxygenase (ABM) superfamily enzyme
MIALQIHFAVADANAAAFERLYEQVYVPALRKQAGYVRSQLLRVFPPQVAQELGALSDAFNYQMQLVFDSEENRRRWVASAEHDSAWPQASGLADAVGWRGFDVAGLDFS